MKPHNEALCPKFQAAMEILAKPWTGLIVATLADGPLRFSEIGERITAIGDRMLSERLKELEALGVVERRVLSCRPVGVEYELTDAGKAFGEVSDAMARWGEKLIAAGEARSDPPPQPAKESRPQTPHPADRRERSATPQTHVSETRTRTTPRPEPALTTKTAKRR